MGSIRPHSLLAAGGAPGEGPQGDEELCLWLWLGLQVWGDDGRPRAGETPPTKQVLASLSPPGRYWSIWVKQGQKETTWVKTSSTVSILNSLLPSKLVPSPV